MQKLHDRVDADAFADLCHDIGAGAAGCRGVGLQQGQIDADVGREVGFVDDEKVGAGDAGAAFARDVLAGGGVDDVDREVCKFGREGGGQVVAAAFDQDQVEVGEGLAQIGDGGKVDAGVFADGGMRSAAGFDAANAVCRQHLGAGQVIGIFAGVDVIGDHRHRAALRQGAAKLFGQRGFAGTHGAADTDAQRAIWVCHVRNILTGMVSWSMAARSARGVVEESDESGRLA